MTQAVERRTCTACVRCGYPAHGLEGLPCIPAVDEDPMRQPCGALIVARFEDEPGSGHWIERCERRHEQEAPSD